MQNVYLFCAANGLATVARDSMDRAKLTEILSLSPRQSIMLAQTVGFPAKPLSIGAEEAKKTALTHAGLPGGSVITDFKCELDKEDGIQVYEVEFKCNGFEYDYEIDAATGKVLKAEKERD